MYIAGRKRTASSPSSTLIDCASYWCPCLPSALSDISSPRLLSRRIFAESRARQNTQSACAQNFFQTFSKQGLAFLRNVPYVALPFDSARMRTELVGFLLHPISRSETWRRLYFSPGNCSSRLLARNRFSSLFHLADVPILGKSISNRQQ